MLGQAKSSTGMEQNIAIFVAYLLGWISGLILLLVEKSNQEVRYHAAQSVVLFGTLTVLSILLPVVPVIGALLVALIGLLSLGLWIVLMVTALMNNPPRLPVVDQYAKQLVSKIQP